MGSQRQRDETTAHQPATPLPLDLAAARELATILVGGAVRGAARGDDHEIYVPGEGWRPAKRRLQKGGFPW